MAFCERCNFSQQSSLETKNRTLVESSVSVPVMAMNMKEVKEGLVGESTF